MRPECPFCGRDPFHYIGNGIGMEAVAVDCCELGDLLFRGMRPAPEEVTFSWQDFVAIAATMSRLRTLANMLAEIIDDIDDVADGKLPSISAATLTRARQALAGKGDRE